MLRSRRGLAWPTITLGLGVATLVTGGLVFRSAWADVWDGTDDYNVARDRTGLVLMPVGAASMIVGTVATIIRASRRGRLRRVERRMRQWNMPFEMVPSAGPMGGHVTARMRF